MYKLYTVHRKAGQDGYRSLVGQLREDTLSGRWVAYPGMHSAGFSRESALATIAKASGNDAAELEVGW